MNQAAHKPLAKEPVTIDGIMSWCKESVQTRRVVHPDQWLDISQKLAVLLEDLDDDLINMEMEYRNLRAEFIGAGESAAAAEVKAKSSEAYRQNLQLKAKRERIAWTIQIAKKRAELAAFDR